MLLTLDGAFSSEKNIIIAKIDLQNIASAFYLIREKSTGKTYKKAILLFFLIYLAYSVNI